MWGSSKNRKSTDREQKQSSGQPRDALAALMDGETPKASQLRFENEKDDAWKHREDKFGGNFYGGRSKGHLDEYVDDSNYNSSSKPSKTSSKSSWDGEYRPQQQTSALDTVKDGAAKSGTYIKDKSVAGANFVKEKDWSKEKEMAEKAGTATKNGAIYVGSGISKGASWLWKSGKNGVDSMRGQK